MLTGEGSMSFQVVRHEHPNIFVVNRQTYETYWFTVGDDGILGHDGLRSDLGEARRTAIAFLAQRDRECGPPPGSEVTAPAPDVCSAPKPEARAAP
jgi:hypothetical protein